MRTLVRSVAAAAGFLLSGCLVSESPLFDASNASATPLDAGDYNACSGSEDASDQECNRMTVELGDVGLYIFAVDDDRIEARFHEIDNRNFAIQMAEDDDGYMYYWGAFDGESLTITLLWCSDLPRALVDKLVSDGSVETDNDYQTCTAKTDGAVIVAAKSYAAGEAKSDTWVKMTPANPVAQ